MPVPMLPTDLCPVNQPPALTSHTLYVECLDVTPNVDYVECLDVTPNVEDHALDVVGAPRSTLHLTWRFRVYGGIFH